MKQDPGINKKEEITFEDIKPYVSMYKGDDGKMVYDILGKDGKSVTKFNNAKDAMEYLRKNFDTLKNKKEGEEGHEGCGPDCADHGCDCEYGRAGKEAKDKELSNKEETVEDFVKSFFDYTSNQFPKGETAVLTSVEKKFGDSAVATAQETIQNLMANKDPEIARIKKLAGVQ